MDKEFFDVSGYQNIRILFAEDDKFTQLLFRNIFQDIGLSIDIAQNGAEVIEKLEKSVYDIVFMDVRMPIMDGVEVTRKIRGELQLDVPIIAMTANLLKGDREKFIAAGMTDYLPKPCGTKNLVDKISRYTKYKNGRAGLKTSKADVREPEVLFSLEKLRDLSNNDAAFLKRLITTFLENTPRLVRQLKRNFKKGNFFEVGETSHQLKSSFKAFKIETIMKDLIALDENWQLMTPEDIKNRIDKVVGVSEKVIAQMKIAQTKL